MGLAPEALRIAHEFSRGPCSADRGSIPGREDLLEKGMAITPVVLPGEFHGQRSLAGCGSRHGKESDTTEWPSLVERSSSRTCLEVHGQTACWNLKGESIFVQCLLKVVSDSFHFLSPQSLGAPLVERKGSLHLHLEQLGELGGYSTLSLPTYSAKEVSSDVEVLTCRGPLSSAWKLVFIPL